MDQRLKEAAQAGNFDNFYSLITANTSLLKDIDTESFAETPLHVAAAAGQFAFAVEMMNLRPAFARTLNKAGFSPMHVALQNGKTQLVYRLLTMDKDLVRVKGREGKTPFHHAVEQGDEQLLNVFLEACPECIQDVTVHYDTALHIALKCDKFKVFESLVKWIRNCRHKDAGGWEESVLNWKDEQGNTLLHIAAIRNNLEAVKLLSEDCSDIVDVRARNLEDLTALQYISKCDDQNEESNESKSQVDTRTKIIRTLQLQAKNPFLIYKRKPPNVRTMVHISRRRKNISEDMRNALLVVMTLIITTTYQSALSPPGGVWSGENSTNSSSSVTGNLHHPGTTVMQNNTFSLLWTYNSLSLLITIGLTLYILPGGPLAFLLLLPLTLLCSSYMLSMSILSPTPQWSKSNRNLAIYIFMLLIPSSYMFLFRSSGLFRKVEGSSTFTFVLKPRVILAEAVLCVVIGLSFLSFRTVKLV